MTVEDIAVHLKMLQEGAAANKLEPDDLADGTITVSNIGAIGGTYAMPLVNGREVAILALGRSAALSLHAPLFKWYFVFEIVCVLSMCLMWLCGVLLIDVNLCA